MHLSIVKVPIDFGIDWVWSSVLFLISNLFFFCQTLRLLFICVGLYIFSETIASECSTFYMAPHIYGFSCTGTGSRHGPWHSLVLFLGGTIGDQWAVDSAIGTGFYELLSVFAKFYPPHMPQFYMPTISNHRNNSKLAPISHYLVPISTGIQWQSPAFGGFICYF